ncbi:putative oligopeptide transporter [Hortaea werneckii]|nr:putative oligopeptide transporter [Hortaea werneckii]
MSTSIAIIGAGPAGCMLARLLTHSQHEIEVTIFEGESSLDFRSQGGTLDLHASTGQRALKAAGLFDEFLKYARYDGEALKVCDKNLLCYITQQGSSNTKSSSFSDRPEIDRPQLRELLFESLPEGTVQWNRKLKSISIDDTLPTLHFADGTTATGFDLIVGADGAWSHVRPTLTDVRPVFSGIGGYSLVIPQAQKQNPKLFDLVNRGSVFAFSDGKSLTAQYMSDGSLNVGVWGVRAEAIAGEGRKKIDTNHDIEDSKVPLKSKLREQYHDWHPSLQAFINEADEDKMVPRDLFMLPIGHRWEHRPGVTLIGDAAHLMGPWAGEGVNLALEDALKLSEAIIASSSGSSSSSSSSSSKAILTKAENVEMESDPSRTLNQHIQTFEREMFVRATRTQQTTWTMMEAMLLTPGAPRTSIERYVLTALAGSSGIGRWTGWVLAPLVYTWFFVFKMIW